MVVYPARVHGAQGRCRIMLLSIASFPVGNVVPLKSEVVFPTGKLGNSASTPTSDSEIRVGKYEFPSPMERSIRPPRFLAECLRGD